MKPDYWTEACEYLSQRDPVMAKLIASYPEGSLVKKSSAFESLCRAIVGQQISVKAAEAIWNRFVQLVGTLQPAAVLEQNENNLRGVGLSRSKVNYLTSLAEHFNSGAIDPQLFDKMDDEAIITSLTDVKGIGRWTAEMFLIFYLQRPDVFSMQDLGLLKAVYLHYFDGEKVTNKQVRSIIEQWSPYRTVASWYLWRSLDPIPVEY